MGRALTQRLQLVTNWNVFPLENAYSSKSKSFTEIGWFWRSCSKMQAIWQLTCLAARFPSRPTGSPCPPELPHHCRGEGCPGLPGSQFLCSLPGQAMGNLGWGQAAPQLRAAVSTACQHPTTGACPSTGDSAHPITQDARSQTPLKNNLRQPQNQTKIKSIWIYLSRAM